MAGLQIPQELHAQAEELYRNHGSAAARKFLAGYGYSINDEAWRSRMRTRGIKNVHNDHTNPWTLEDIAYLNTHYPDAAVPIATIAAHLNRSISAIKYKAGQLGLTRRVLVPGSIMPRIAVPHIYVTKPVLVLADVHVPYQNGEWIDRVIDLATAWGAEEVILAGDAIDAQSVSKFEKTAFPSIADEIGAWKAFEGALLEHFETVHWVLGNHEARLGKAMDWAIPLHQLITGQFVTDEERVTVYDSYAIQVNDWRIEHPKGHGRSAALNLVPFHLMNVAIAHTHHSDVQRDSSGRFYAIRIGAAADHTRMAYCQRITHGKDVMTNGALILVPRPDGTLAPYNLEPDHDLGRIKGAYRPEEWEDRTEDWAGDPEPAM